MGVVCGAAKLGSVVEHSVSVNLLAALGFPPYGETSAKQHVWCGDSVVWSGVVCDVVCGVL